MIKLLLFLVCSVSHLSATADRPFAFVDLGLSSHEKGILQALDVGQEETFDFYGSPADMQDALREFVATIGTNSDETIDTATQVIARISSDVVQETQKQAAWTTVRATLANNSFDVPRWHQDGYYFAPFSGFACKFAAVLKGPSTFFYLLPEKLKLERIGTPMGSHCFSPRREAM